MASCVFARSRSTRNRVGRHLGPQCLRRRGSALLNSLLQQRNELIEARNLLVEDFDPALSAHHRDECDGRLRQHLQPGCPPLPNRRADTRLSGRQSCLSLAAKFDELAELEVCLGRLQSFVRSRAERVVEFERKLGIRKSAGLDLETGRNADIALRRREARIRRQSALQRQANEIDRGALSAAWTGIVTTSNAQIRRKATVSTYIISTGKTERRRGLAACGYDCQVRCLGGGVSSPGWSSSRNIGASADNLTGLAGGSATKTGAGMITGAQV